MNYYKKEPQNWKQKYDRNDYRKVTYWKSLYSYEVRLALQMICEQFVPVKMSRTKGEIKYKFYTKEKILEVVGKDFEEVRKKVLDYITAKLNYKEITLHDTDTDRLLGEE